MNLSILKNFKISRNASWTRNGKIPIDQETAIYLKSCFGLTGRYKEVLRGVDNPFMNVFNFNRRRQFHQNEYLYFENFQVNIRKVNDFKYFDENMQLKIIKSNPDFFFNYKFVREIMFIPL